MTNNTQLVFAFVAFVAFALLSGCATVKPLRSFDVTSDTDDRISLNKADEVPAECQHLRVVRDRAIQDGTAHMMCHPLFPVPTNGKWQITVKFDCDPPGWSTQLCSPHFQYSFNPAGHGNGGFTVGHIFRTCRELTDECWKSVAESFEEGIRRSGKVLRAQQDYDSFMQGGETAPLPEGVELTPAEVDDCVAAARAELGTFDPVAWQAAQDRAAPASQAFADFSKAEGDLMQAEPEIERCADDPSYCLAGLRRAQEMGYGHAYWDGLPEDVQRRLEADY